MATKKSESSEAKKTTSKKREAPAIVRVRSAGQISQALEGYAAKYRENYPNRAVRYVYDPTHKPELSNVLGRQAMGYELVKYRELELDSDSVDDDAVVRVGDLVLMSIDADTKQALVEEREGWAKDQMKQVQRKFYNEVEEAAEKRTPSHHSGPAARPLGRAVIEERSFEYDVKQREE